jgi:hypothetical protein
MDLRDSFHAWLANNQQMWTRAISEKCGHKDRELQRFWKPHKLTIQVRFSEATILEHSKACNFQASPFSIFGLYLLSRIIILT